MTEQTVVETVTMKTLAWHMEVLNEYLPRNERLKKLFYFWKKNTNQKIPCPFAVPLSHSLDC